MKTVVCVALNGVDANPWVVLERRPDRDRFQNRCRSFAAGTGPGSPCLGVRGSQPVRLVAAQRAGLQDVWRRSREHERQAARERAHR